MAKVNLGHTRLSHASEMCQEATLECLNKPGYEDTLNAVKKGAISIN